jgi:hypothetical protein
MQLDVRVCPMRAGKSSPSSAYFRWLNTRIGVETSNDIPNLWANRTTGVDVNRTLQILPLCRFQFEGDGRGRSSPRGCLAGKGELERQQDVNGCCGRLALRRLSP